MISGDVRESAHPRMIANGCCPCAVSARRAAVGLPDETLLFTKRALPSFSFASAASALTEAVGCSAAKTNAKTANRLTNAMTLEVIFMVVCDYVPRTH